MKRLFTERRSTNLKSGSFLDGEPVASRAGRPFITSELLGDLTSQPSSERPPQRGACSRRDLAETRAELKGRSILVNNEYLSVSANNLPVFGALVKVKALNTLQFAHLQNTACFFGHTSSHSVHRLHPG